jgi:hypothetical protein
MLSALRTEGPVTLVADGSKADLAAGRLGIAGRDAESRRFGELWVAGSRPTPERSVGRVVAFLGPGPGTETWAANAAAMFPCATIELIAERPDARLARAWSVRGGAAQPNQNPEGPVVLHVGAGSEAKRWPLDRWLEVANRVRACGKTAALLAGEVELERMPGGERAAFAAAGGAFLSSLDTLADRIHSASIFVGADSGPTHLAAQLGVRTVALFGPTDPDRWAPVGPAVRVIVPDAPAGMEWLAPGAVARALGC